MKDSSASCLTPLQAGQPSVEGRQVNLYLEIYLVRLKLLAGITLKNIENHLDSTDGFNYNSRNNYMQEILQQNINHKYNVHCTRLEIASQLTPVHV